MSFTRILDKQIRTNPVTGDQEVVTLTETYGLSTEAKPTTNVVGGCVFIETDHVDGIVLYMYDELTHSWIKQ